MEVDIRAGGGRWFNDTEFTGDRWFCRVFIVVILRDCAAFTIPGNIRLLDKFWG